MTIKQLNTLRIIWPISFSGKDQGRESFVCVDQYNRGCPKEKKNMKNKSVICNLYLTFEGEIFWTLLHCHPLDFSLIYNESDEVFGSETTLSMVGISPEPNSLKPIRHLIISKLKNVMKRAVTLPHPLCNVSQTHETSPDHPASGCLNSAARQVLKSVKDFMTYRVPRKSEI